MNKYDLFENGSTYKDSENSHTITIKKAKSPWTVTVIGDFKDLQAWRKAEVVRMAIVQERSDAKASETRARAMSYIASQDAPEDRRSCECGAISAGYDAHSTWCPIFKLNFSRNKTSFTPINTGNDD